MSRQRAAFTLLELMVVILIIAVVIAIVLPSIGPVRDSARRSDTQGMLNRIGQAAASFQADERRLPGYFSQKEMGDSANGSMAATGRGMSAMENVMLDLIGQSAAAGAAGPADLPVGPIVTNPQFTVNVDTFGVTPSGKSYFVPDPKHYVAQALGTGQDSLAGLGHAAGEGLPQLKDVVDAWGNPILVWVKDERAVQKVTALGDFAAIDSSAAGPSRFYWASNACFLRAKSLGKKGYDQTDVNKGSMLNATAAGSNMNALQSLAGMLGSPSYPVSTTTVPFLPAEARSSFMLQSTGADGVYLSRKDRGFKQFSATGFIDYGVNLAPDPTMAVSATNRYTDANGTPTNNDLLKLFDDVIVPAGTN